MVSENVKRICEEVWNPYIPSTIVWIPWNETEEYKALKREKDNSEYVKF